MSQNTSTACGNYLRNETPKWRAQEKLVESRFQDRDDRIR